MTQFAGQQLLMLVTVLLLSGLCFDQGWEWTIQNVPFFCLPPSLPPQDTAYTFGFWGSTHESETKVIGNKCDPSWEKGGSINWCPAELS